MNTNIITVYPELKKQATISNGLCWAACIEMATNKSDIQNDLLEKLRSMWGMKYKTTMPCKKEYYLKLFENNAILDSQGCEQYQTFTFPNHEFIEKQINKNQPIIFSGIHYPLYPSGESLHAIVIQGYKYHKNIFWVLALDPRSQGKTFKIAWVYNELIRIDTLVRSFDNLHKHKIDFVTNFNEVSISNKLVSTDFPPNNFPKNPEYLRCNNREMTQALSEYIIGEKRELINEYFEITQDLEFKNYGIKYKSLDNAFKDNRLRKTYYYPAWVGDKVVLEFIFFELKSRKLALIGIQEPIGVQLITKVEIENLDADRMDSFEFKHKKPNYEIVNIEPFNYVFLKFKKKINDKDFFYTPLKEYDLPNFNSSFKNNRAYSEKEIQNFILTKTRKKNEQKS